MAAHTDNSVSIEAPLQFVWERMMDIESWPQPVQRVRRRGGARAATATRFASG